MNNIIKKITFLENTPIKKILDSFGKNQHLTSGRGFGLILNKKKTMSGNFDRWRCEKIFTQGRIN